MHLITGSWLDPSRLPGGLTAGLVVGAMLAFSADRPAPTPSQDSSTLVMSLTLPESAAYESGTYQRMEASDFSRVAASDFSRVAASDSSRVAASDSSRLAASDSSPGHQLGIPFGLYHLPETEFAPPFTSALRSVSNPADAIPILEAARRAGVKIYLNMFVGRRHIQNPDGSFSLELWKQRIDRFRDLGLEPFISDGTLAGNYLMDEPYSRGKWNGQAVPYVDIEAMAAYSKQLWPELTTIIRADPLFLKKAPFRWVYLDAAWAQYTTRKGKVEDYARSHAEVAKELGLGLVVGLNVLDGGDRSSGMEGTKLNYSAMSAEEVMHYGSVMLREPGACALILWKYDREDRAYFSRPDIRAALETLGLLAASHPPTRCRVR
ncbi:MAG: hypothetical protein ABI785_07190 [Gemmatimonadales bacterium]